MPVRFQVAVTPVGRQKRRREDGHEGSARRPLYKGVHRHTHTHACAETRTCIRDLQDTRAVLEADAHGTRNGPVSGSRRVPVSPRSADG